MYSCIKLSKKSQIKLLQAFAEDIPKDWSIFAHHMTVVFGKGLPNQQDLDKNIQLIVTHVGMSKKAMAVKVEGYPSNNKIPHITLAVSPDGKPVMSNDIKNWSKVDNIKLNGVATEIHFA
tara:strand:- start:7577 stop:7936 length:360 start_codon:yes stop_codon:yes gene_type:complete